MSIRNWLSIGALVAIAAIPAPAEAAVEAVATTTDVAWVVQQVGGANVRVTSLAPGDRDPHRIEARPSQVTRIARADLFARIGLELDSWADALLRAANNRKVSPGGPGYCDCSAGVRALEVPQGRVDASMGEVHLRGNPHYWLDPANVANAARNVAEALGRVDPANRDLYQRNYQALRRRLDEALRRWQEALAPFRGRRIVTYHKTFPYFFQRFGLVEFANVEPKPGIEPSAGHIADVSRRMRAEGVRVILAETYRNRRYAELLARQGGGVVVYVPVSVGGERGVDDYFRLMDTIVERLVAALR